MIKRQYIILDSSNAPVRDNYNTIIVFKSKEDADEAMKVEKLYVHTAVPLVPWKKPRKKT